MLKQSRVLAFTLDEGSKFCTSYVSFTAYGVIDYQRRAVYLSCDSLDTNPNAAAIIQHIGEHIYTKTKMTPVHIASATVQICTDSCSTMSGKNAGVQKSFVEEFAPLALTKNCDAHQLQLGAVSLDKQELRSITMVVFVSDAVCFRSFLHLLIVAWPLICIFRLSLIFQLRHCHSHMTRKTKNV